MDFIHQSELNRNLIENHRIRGYNVDGYDNETNTIYEYYGCFFHGCPMDVQDAMTSVYSIHW
jgi:hypothetical protein